METQITLEEAMPILAESAQVRERLQDEFPGIADDLLSLMRRRDLNNPLGSQVHDLLQDEIENATEKVWNGILLGGEGEYDDQEYEDEDVDEEDLQDKEDPEYEEGGDIYPVEIRHFGGVYVVWALESGTEGYFLSFNHAKVNRPGKRGGS